MAIKIIKQAAERFTMECHRCECVFEYNLEDINKKYTQESVICPVCNGVNPHNERMRIDIEEFVATKDYVGMVDELAKDIIETLEDCGGDCSHCEFERYKDEKIPCGAYKHAKALLHRGWIK